MRHRSSGVIYYLVILRIVCSYKWHESHLLIVVRLRFTLRRPGRSLPAEVCGGYAGLATPEPRAIYVQVRVVAFVSNIHASLTQAADVTCVPRLEQAERYRAPCNALFSIVVAEHLILDRVSAQLAPKTVGLASAGFI